MTFQFKSENLRLDCFPIGSSSRVGLHLSEDSSEIEEVEDCLLQDSTSNTILAIVKEHIASLQSQASGNIFLSHL